MADDKYQEVYDIINQKAKEIQVEAKDKFAEALIEAINVMVSKEVKTHLLEVAKFIINLWEKR
jgi:hypothetical protein